MSPGGAGIAEGRFSVEMSETGEVGIRDRRSGLLYLTTGLEDADDDVVYLLERAARGDEDEVLRHLTYNDETARRRRPPAPATGALPPEGAGHDPSPAVGAPLRRGDAPDPDPAPRHAASRSLRDQVLAQAARWTVAVEAVEAHSAALAAAGSVRDLARRVEAAHAALTFARTRLADSAGRLFADPVAARGRLAEGISREGLEPTVARLRTDPALFGVLAPRPSSRFGPWSAARDVARTAGEVSTAIRESISATAAVDAVAAEAASATRIPDDPPATPHGLAAWLRAAADEILAGIPAAPSPAALQQQTAALRASLARLPAADRDQVARSVPRARRLLAELQRPATTPTLER
jgi:hypothetical protein